jgi:hypothetical protein
LISWQIAPGKLKSPALLTTRDLSSNLFRIAVERLAELFSGLFYVAASRLNSPRSVLHIETSNAHAVNSSYGVAGTFYAEALQNGS